MFGIVETLTKHQFIARFKEVRPYQFSDKGLEIIFDYLEGYADSLNRDIEFDPIAICCEFAEMDIDEFTLNLSNLKHIDVDIEDYDSFNKIIEAATDAGVIVAGYCEDADTVITESYSW